MLAPYPAPSGGMNASPLTDLGASAARRTGTNGSVRRRPALWLRMAYGAALLLRPRGVLGRLGARAPRAPWWRPPARSARATWRRPPPRGASRGAASRDLGAAVDALHAASMLALAARRSARRRPALASAAVAGLLCAEELHPLTRST